MGRPVPAGAIAMPAGDVFDRLRRSCMAEVEASSCVSVDPQAARDYAATLSAEKVLDVASAETRLPLQFDSLEAEVNLLVLMHLLSFGSGYEAMLQEACRMGWQECMQFGVLGMYISGNRLDAEFLARFSDLQVNNFFRIPTHQDVPSEMHPAIQISQPGPLMPLARAIRQQLQQLGEALGEAGCTSAGEFVIAKLEEGAGSGAPSAAALVQQLGELMPGFQDQAEGESGLVELHAKAQQLAAHLHQRFSRGDSRRFAFADAGKMAASADSVLPGVLRALGIIQVSGAAEEALGSQGDASGAPWVPALRAAAVVAVDAIAGALPPAPGAEHPTARQVDAYLRACELENLSGVQALAVRDTVFF